MKEKEVFQFLGTKAKCFSPTGIRFLSLRSRGPKKDYVQIVLEAYAKGKFSQISRRLNMELAEAFSLPELKEEDIAIILLGRAPRHNREGGTQESNHIWPAESVQAEAARRLSEHFKIKLYENRRPTSHYTAPKTYSSGAPETTSRVKRKTATH